MTGAVIVVSSDAGAEAYETWGGYGASKAALDQLAAVEVYGHRLGDIASISNSRLGGSTLNTIKTRAEVEALDERRKSALAKAAA